MDIRRPAAPRPGTAPPQVESDIDYQRDHAAWYAEARRVVDEQDASFSEGRRLGQTKKILPKGWPVAWALLHHRRDHEYERVRLDDVREPKTPRA
jgi:hypothetical protein